MPASPQISDRIDDGKLSESQIAIGVLCGLCLVMNGFDVQSLAFVAPALFEDLHIPPSALGPVFGAAALGMLLGSIINGLLADLLGRRPVLIFGTLYFGCFTLLTTRATTVEEFAAVRFLAGLGLGGILPSVMALMAECSPRKHRIVLMMIIADGFTVGAAFSGFVSAWLVPSHGWRAVFYLGGAIPLLLAFLMWFMLPESLKFLTIRGAKPPDVDNRLPRAQPRWNRLACTQYRSGQGRLAGAPYIHLFRHGRAKSTLLLWAICFTTLIDFYFLSSWLPTVVKESGYATSRAVLVGAMFQVGGAVGTVGLGWAMGKWGFLKVLGIHLAIACASIAMIGRAGIPLALLFLLVTLAGWCVIGGQSGVNVLAGNFYPTYLRSTGVGWCLGVGRLGSIVGPLVGGELIALKWSTQSIFLAAAAPALISAMLLFALRRMTKSTTAPPAGEHFKNPPDSGTRSPEFEDEGWTVER
jgi:AAHS family 4-hydroxybenzoate transporter-like MFS transporter